MRRKYEATSFQYFVLVAAGIIANGIMTLPRAVAAHAGRDAWLVVLATGILMTSAAVLLHKLASYFPDQDPSQWVISLLGPILGRCWLALLVVKALIFTYLTAKLYAGILSVRILLFTPTYVVAAAIITLAFLACVSSLRGLARYSETVFLLKSPLLLLLMAPLFLGRSYHLFPVLIETPVSSLAKAVPAATFSYVGFEILWFIYPYLKNKSYALPVISLGFSTLLYTLTTISATMFFGPERLQTLLLPTLSMLSIIQTSFVERIDSIFLWVWVGTVTVTAATQFYIGARSVQGIFPKFQFQKICSGMAGLLLVAVVPIRSLPTIYVWADWLGIFDVTLVIGSTLLFLLLILVKRHFRRADHE